jgi:hypothetical protein
MVLLNDTLICPYVAWNAWLMLLLAMILGGLFLHFLDMARWLRLDEVCAFLCFFHRLFVGILSQGISLLLALWIGGPYTIWLCLAPLSGLNE